MSWVDDEDSESDWSLVVESDSGHLVLLVAGVILDTEFVEISVNCL